MSMFVMMILIKKTDMANRNKSILSREDEINVIAYQIKGSDDLILGRYNSTEWLVSTSDGILIYSTNEMKGVYNIDFNKSNFERLGWTA